MITALIVFFLLSSVIGLFLMTKPQGAIELQRRFYEKINWRIEPISMPKEIRNTRIMGWILAILALIIILYIFINSLR